MASEKFSMIWVRVGGRFSKESIVTSHEKKKVGSFKYSLRAKQISNELYYSDVNKL